jgi:hypothetical protein
MKGKRVQFESIAAIATALTLVGGVLSGVATYINLRKQAERARVSAERSDEIAKLNREIADLTKQANAAITGGDSCTDIGGISVTFLACGARCRRSTRSFSKGTR